MPSNCPNKWDHFIPLQSRFNNFHLFRISLFNREITGGFFNFDPNFSHISEKPFKFNYFEEICPKPNKENQGITGKLSPAPPAKLANSPCHNRAYGAAWR
jgi:hypothetical protein